MAMADTGERVSAPSGVDLDRLSDEEVLNLIIAAFDRLRPDQLAQAQNAILEKRKVREEEVRNAFLAEMRERALELGISIESLFPGGKRRTRSGRENEPGEIDGHSFALRGLDRGEVHRF